MLFVDLNRLQREGRARIDASVPPDDRFWAGSNLAPHTPLDVRLEAQQAATDVVVRGRMAGEFELSCRRCLEPVVAGIDEEVGLLYRAGMEVGDDEPADVLPLPRSGTLDLTGPLREHVLLAVPKYVYCREECRGLCPQCGANLNQAVCGCISEEFDDRWGPLRQLRVDE
jgi:uncharacterized protein